MPAVSSPGGSAAADADGDEDGDEHAAGRVDKAASRIDKAPDLTIGLRFVRTCCTRYASPAAPAPET
jgi:hypothetical protein